MSLRFASAIVFVLFSTHARAEPSSCTQGFAQIVDAASRAEPDVLLRSRGLDTDALRFVLQEEAPFGMTLKVLYRNQNAGHIHVSQEFDIDGKLQPVVEKVELESAVRGTGLGQILYLAVAREYLNKKGLLLRKSGLTTSDADKLWERLLAKSYAEELVTSMGEKALQIRRTALEGSEGTAAHGFVMQRLLEGVHP
jgi:hypothetical protein